ncbi:MAG TPA: cobyrinate a,c-diamide synthase [Thermodesulfovibrionales bacterium]|nr:cobyrinate a,c-diamide synthase [Thermodesulfovibrionales bacterium]
MRKYPRVIVAGLKGGSGKTTIALGIIAALKSHKGLKVIPYKKGPDYIDAGWLARAAGTSCYNLDPFLMPKEKAFQSFVSHFYGDIAVIEGNRGLYDGVDEAGSYSTAEVSKLLKSPVILVVDCAKMTRTAAALVLGCMHLDPEVSIKGVVLNQISGSRHENVARKSIERYCALPVLGAIPRLRSENLPERHMGLTPHQEHGDADRVISAVEDMAIKYLDLEGILKIANEATPLPDHKDHAAFNGNASERNIRIGVIRDTAFQFYYPENIEELEKKGARIVEINSLEDGLLPDVHAIYIGGGFPETHALALARNTKFRNALRRAVEEGLPVYAECGGLMFLGDALIVEGERYSMAGIFPLVFEMRTRPQAHGYTIVEVERQNPFYPPGTIMHGHEFHYSAVLNCPEDGMLPTAFRMRKGSGIGKGVDGLWYKNAFATYTHLHAYGAQEWGKAMVRLAKKFSETRTSLRT